MTLVPLYGHAALRRRFQEGVAGGRLASSLLLQGPRGIGKQRLALWIGQLLLCAGEGDRPCGRCQSCRYAAAATHPDLHWFWPRPRLKEGDVSAEEVRADYVDALAERLRAGGLYAAPSGTEGIFIATVRALVQSAALAPALARRKVFIVGDADRMVPQEGSEQAANAFLKLLEEPPADTTIILTSSEPGALLPTIRSRVVAVRVPILPEADVRAFLKDQAVAAALDAEGLPASADARVRLAAGAPGTLFGGAAQAEALEQARRLLAAATGHPADRYRRALAQGATRARGGFADALDALTTLLHERARASVERRESAAALAATRAVDAVERAKGLADGNVSPPLIAAALLRDLNRLLR